MFKYPILLSLFFGFVLTLLAYSGHFDNAFHFDDNHTIVNNTAIEYLSNIPKFFSDNTLGSILPSNQIYRPFAFATFTIDYWIAGGRKVEMFHITSFLFLIGQMFLLIWSLKLLLDHIQTDQKIQHAILLFSALFFGLHPANAESVNYIIARADMMSSFFLTLTFICLLKAKKNSGYLYLGLVSILLGMFSKETTVTVFLVLAAYIWVYETEGIGWIKSMQKIVAQIWPYALFSIAIAVFILLHMSKSHIAGTASRLDYALTQPYIILLYFLTFLAPLRLSADTDEGLITGYFDPKILIGFLFISGLCYLIYISRKQKDTKIISFGLLWFLITLLPTSSFLPLSEVMNDHRIFIANIGLFIATAGVLAYVYQKHALYLQTKKHYILGAAIVFLSFNFYGTVQRCKVWDSEESLWHDVTIKSPHNGRGLMNYGLTLMAKGNYVGALDCFNRALVFNPYYSYLQINLGICKNAMGNSIEAEAHFQKGIQLAAFSAEPYYQYAKYLGEKNRVDEAIVQLQKAISISPAHMICRQQLLVLYMKKGDKKEAQQLLESSLQISPSDAFFTAMKSQVGQMNEAGTVSQNSSQSLNPAHQEQNLNNQAKTVFSTKEEYINQSLAANAQGDYVEMIRLCEGALKLDPNYAVAHNNMGHAYIQLHQYDKAIKACEQAIALDPSLQIAKNNLILAKSSVSN